MKNILFFDFDDTLYSHRLKTVCQDVQAALARLHTPENIIAIISGRGKESERFIQENLAIEPDYLILMNGQLIFRGHELIHEEFAEASNIKKVIAVAEKLGFACGGYAKDGIVVNTMNPRVVKVWKDFSAELPAVVSTNLAEMPIYQGHLYISRDEADYFSEELKDYIVNWSHKYLVNMIPKEAGKAKAVKWCMSLLGVPFQNSYAFGDGFNDVDMMSAVAHGVAIGDESPALIAAAEYVAPSSDNAGVVNALKYYSLLHEGDQTANYV